MYTKSISAVTKNQNFQWKEIFTGIKHYHMPEDLSDSNSNLISEFKVWVCCGGGLFCGLVFWIFFFFLKERGVEDFDLGICDFF